MVTLIAALVIPPIAYRARSTEVAAISSILMALVSLTGRLETILSGSVMQFFGRISYSLYLLHAPVGWRFISVVRRKFGPELGPGMGTAAFMGGVLLSVVAAWLLYIVVERPSTRFARRIKLPIARRKAGAI
jgi:peptidoglycan/LPS O-acetylase OafA/YrhL